MPSSKPLTSTRVLARGLRTRRLRSTERPPESFLTKLIPFSFLQRNSLIAKALSLLRKDMGKVPKSKGGFYAVHTGRTPGVYGTWDECKAQTFGFSSAKYKKFATFAEAEAFAFPDRQPAEPSNNAAASSSQAAVTVKVAGHSENRSRRSPPHAATANPTTGTIGALSTELMLRNKTRPTSPRSRRSRTPEIDETGWMVVYTDGACKGNQKGSSVARAGVGVWWGHNDERNLAERCPGDQTNNRAELIALVRALEMVPYSSVPLMLKTDSKYSIQCFESWIHNWIKRNWKTTDGKPVKNAPLIRYLSSLLDARARASQKVRLVYVRGHAGIAGNEGADQLANQGAILAEVPERDWDSLATSMRKRIDAPVEKIRPMPYGAYNIISPAQSIASTSTFHGL